MALSSSRVRSRIPRRRRPLKTPAASARLFPGFLVVLILAGGFAFASCKTTTKDDGKTSSDKTQSDSTAAKKVDLSDSTTASEGERSRNDSKRTTKTEDKSDGSTRKSDTSDRSRDETSEKSDKKSGTAEKKETADRTDAKSKDDKRHEDSSRIPRSDSPGRDKDSPRRKDEKDEDLVEIRRVKEQKEILPEDKNDGFVSDSAYQVFITVFARDEAEAVRVGKADASRKALNLILKDVNRAGESARKEMKRYVETNGEVVKVVQESRDSWSIVYRVQKEGMREFVKRLK